MTELKTESRPTYAPSYKVIDHCLLETKNSKQGPYDKKLCNFMPWITSEVTLDDGAQTTTRIRLRGIHQSGRELPEIEIPADELGNFNWVAKYWGINCILEVGQNVKDSLRYAIQTTAESADHQTVYSVTGWKKINGVWEFLMPGAEKLTVHLPGKMQGYRMEQKYDYLDVQVVSCLMQDSFAPDEILLPLLAFTFLTPLNHFLKLAGCEPKFVLFLAGKTGSQKSTLAALFLSFFGRFTGTELPLSFRDTANSILHNTFTLKDVLTCIDDFHPAGRQEEQKLTATAQSIMRAYGDRTGKGRLRADSTPMDARPPQGNAIITAEFPPDIGESGTSRYFALELKNGDIDLEYLTSLQREAERGTLRRCMFAYIQWLKELFFGYLAGKSDPEQRSGHGGNSGNTLSANLLRSTERMDRELDEATGAGRGVPANPVPADQPAIHPEGVGADAGSAAAVLASGETGHSGNYPQHTPTGWENERAIFYRYIENALRQSQSYGRFGAAFGAAHCEEGRPGFHPIGGTVGAGLRSAAALGQLIDNDSDDPEEQRKKIEAQHAASNLGAVIGITAEIISALTEKEEPSTQEKEGFKEFLAEMDREYEYEEKQTWQQTM